MEVERLAEAAEATFWIQRGWYRGTGHERFTSWFARFERQEILSLPDAFRACGMRHDEATRFVRSYLGGREHDRYTWYTADHVPVVIGVSGMWEQRIPRIHLIPSPAITAMPKVVVHARG